MLFHLLTLKAVIKSVALPLVRRDEEEEEGRRREEEGEGREEEKGEEKPTCSW